MSDDVTTTHHEVLEAGEHDEQLATALSPRELEVLRLLIRGDDIQRMSRELGISVHTVRSYVRSLLRKLDCRTQLQAVVRALQLGLITLDDV